MLLQVLISELMGVNCSLVEYLFATVLCMSSMA